MPPAARACRAWCSPPRRRRWGRRAAPSAARPRGTAAATSRPTSAPSTRASWRRSPPPAAAGVELVAVNPSSVQGPGRAGGTGRILIAYLNGRLRAFVDTRMSLVDIEDCVTGHLLGAERGVAGERYVLNGATLSARDALELVSELSGIRHHVRVLPPFVATVAGAVVEGVFRLRGKKPPFCREMVDHVPARAPLRRLARGARARAALHAGRRDLPPHDRVGARRGARPRGLIRRRSRRGAARPRRGARRPRRPPTAPGRGAPAG